MAGKGIQNRAAICPNILATIFNRMKPGALTEIFHSDECYVVVCRVNFRFPFFLLFLFNSFFLIPLIGNCACTLSPIGRHWIGEVLFNFVEKFMRNCKKLRSLYIGIVKFVSFKWIIEIDSR